MSEEIEEIELETKNQEERGDVNEQTEAGEVSKSEKPFAEEAGVTFNEEVSKAPPLGPERNIQSFMSTKSRDIELGKVSKKVTPLRLEWYDLYKEVELITGGCCKKKESKTKVLIQNISGEAKPGELLALMGPSGAGKTTVLNSLAKRQALTSGKILLNGRKLPKNYNKISAYVMQDDRLYEVMTPRELFTFSAQLRLPRGTTKQEITEMVDLVIEKLKMNSCADTKVGGRMLRGISGGERKRTSIGYEIITNPSLLFLDEPTSGLDSFTALSLLQSLQDLAIDGHTIVCTIHQPSSEIFALFDKLMLLVKGEVAYFGKASDSISFFASLGHPCPTFTNPSDFFMALLQTQTDEQMARSKKFIDAMAPNLPKFDEGRVKEDYKIEDVPRASSWTEFALLTKRSWQVILRNPLTFRARVGQTIIVGIMSGLVFLKLTTNQDGVDNRFGALFFIVTSNTFPVINSVLLTFPLERALLYREQSNGMYGVTNYYLGKFISGFPFEVFFPILFSLIVYWMVQLNTQRVDAFFYFIFGMFSSYFYSSAFGTLLGCIFPNPEVALTVAPLMVVPLMLFAGFYVSLSSIPDWLSWIQYISVYKWGYQALLVNEFTGLNFTCTESQYVQVPTSRGIINVCPITEGEQVLNSLGYTFDWDYWIAVGVLLGLGVFFRITALIALKSQIALALKRTQT